MFCEFSLGFPKIKIASKILDGIFDFISVLRVFSSQKIKKLYFDVVGRDAPLVLVRFWVLFIIFLEEFSV